MGESLLVCKADLIEIFCGAGRRDMARFSVDNDEILIEEVQKYLCIFDYEDKNYKNFVIKENAWKKIAFSVGKDGDGYLSEIIFIDVKGTTLQNEEKTFNIALKCSKKIIGQRESIKKTYKNEINMYKNVIPAFQRFLNEKQQPMFESVAKCFSTATIEGVVYIALQNLKKQGFELTDRRNPFTKSHLYLTLEAYGKFHAISFALKDQNKEYFDKILNLEQIWKIWYENETKENGFIRPQEDKIITCLTENKEFEVLNKFKKLYAPCHENFYKLIIENEEKSVITHGDCWHNNFLFQYRTDDTLKQNPTKVVFLDFQMSTLASPVFDLAYHIYIVASSEDLTRLKDFLQVYYRSLEKNIRKLGSDPEKLFTYEDLIQHWKKYHLIGLLIATLVMPVTLLEKGDVIDLENMTEETKNGPIKKMMEKIKDKMDRRIIDLVKHVVTYKV